MIRVDIVEEANNPGLFRYRVPGMATRMAVSSRTVMARVRASVSGGKDPVPGGAVGG
jgi:hypothetical protein